MKAVITSAGKATRTRPFSYATPKALMPLIGREGNNEADPKSTKLVPILDCIFMQLQNAGAKEFCVICATEFQRDKIADYFKQTEWTILESDHDVSAEKDGIMVRFVVHGGYKGFGDAVLAAERFADGQAVFIHADDVISREGYLVMSQLLEEKQADAVLLLRKVEDPSHFGIVEAEEDGSIDGKKVYVIKGAVEKPKREEAKSNIAISAVYLFKADIFNAIRRHPPSARGELELTGGIDEIIKAGGKVYGILLEHGTWLNVGTPFTYADAIANTRAAPWPLKA